MKRLLVLCCCFAIAVAGCSKEKSADTAVGVKEKSVAPEISVISLDNQQLTLASLKGKVVLLNFWATWCPPCREEIPSMMKLNSSMVGKPFKMVCVSVDEGGKKAVEDFSKTLVTPCPHMLTQAVRQLAATALPVFRKPLSSIRTALWSNG